MRAVHLTAKLTLFDSGRVSGRLLRGMGSSFTANATAVGVAFGSSLVLARALGSEDFGVFTYVVSWLNIAVLVATLGLDAALVRFLPEYAAREDWAGIRGVLGWSRRAALMSSVVAAVILAAVGRRIVRSQRIGGGPDGVHRCGIVAAAGARGCQPRLTARISTRRIQPDAARDSAPAAADRRRCRVLAARDTALGAGGDGAERCCLAGALWVGARWLRQAIPAAAVPAAPRTEGRHWLRVALPMLSVSGMGLLLHETSVIVTGVVAGTTLAGVYAVATRLSRLLAFGMTAGNSIANPLISELYAQQDQRRLQLVTSTASTVSLSVAVVLLVALAVGGPFVLAAFGEAFLAGQSVVLILAAGQLCQRSHRTVAGLLNMTGHQDWYARITMTISTLNVIGNVPAVMWWEIEGAAVVTSTLIAVQNAWAWYAVSPIPRNRLDAAGIPADSRNARRGREGIRRRQHTGPAARGITLGTIEHRRRSICGDEKSTRRFSRTQRLPTSIATCSAGSMMDQNPKKSHC